MAGKKDRKDQMEEKDHKKEELPDLNRNNIGNQQNNQKETQTGNQPDNQKENKIEHHPQAGKDGELSPEEYRRKAEEHMNAVKDIWKIFGKTGVFVLAAALVIAIFSMAWFVSNNKVQVSEMAVSSAGSYFELAAPGNATGKWDSKVLSGIASGDNFDIQDNSGAAMVTSDSKNSILWAISSSSNMGNDTEEGIRPGSLGQLTFYIVSKKSGTLTVSLNLALTGRKISKGESTVGVSADEQQLLEGHLLLFAGYDDAKKAYKGWISEDAKPWTMNLNYSGTGNSEDVTAVLRRENDGGLTWTADVEEGKAYPVTIYWIWPEVFGQYLFTDLTYLGDRPVLFQKDSSDTPNSNPAALPSDLFEKMRDTGNEESGTVKSNRYFKWAWNDSDNSKEEFKSLFLSTNPDQIFLDLRGGNMNTINYGKLCSYYNMADQYLGETVRYVELKLDAK